METIILVIDEIQKIANWSEVVKKEWDDDTFHDRNIKVLLLGSSRVLLEKGLSESLAGRFEEIRMSHWSYPEMKECFGFSIDQYMFYGGYPGAASLIDDEDRFQQYIQSFRQLFHPQSSFIVGDGGIAVEDFLSMNIRKLF